MSDESHRTAERFDFGPDRRVRVIVCRRVQEGAPILHVSHDADGDWQFLCGAEHAEDGPDSAVVACLECVVADDPSLNDLADLEAGWGADREGVGEPWARHDHVEDDIRRTVAEHGWFVALIDAGEDGEPPFAYTIGLHQSYGHPELICIGLDPEVMHAMLNGCGDLIKAGQKLPIDVSFGEILEDQPVQLREVRAPASYDEHVGYALWFAGGREFPLLQLVWPDASGRFPGDPDADPALARQQPLLP